MKFFCVGKKVIVGIFLKVGEVGFLGEGVFLGLFLKGFVLESFEERIFWDLGDIVFKMGFGVVG